MAPCSTISGRCDGWQGRDRGDPDGGRERTGITSLKVGYNRVFGYYIEVTNAHRAAIVPGDYQRRQTLTGAERYVTPALKEYEERVLHGRRADRAC